MKPSPGFAPERGRLEGFNSPNAPNSSGLKIACKEELRPRLLLVLDAKSNASRGPPPSHLHSAECCDLARSSR